jgi:predicted DsbA family dithiol-disulfide isomerase
MAIENPLVKSEVIEANEFAALSDRYRVRAVPKTVINGRVEVVGNVPEKTLLEAVQKAITNETN